MMDLPGLRSAGHGSHILTVQSEYVNKQFGPLVSGSKSEECEFISSLPQSVKAGQNEEVWLLLQGSRFPAGHPTRDTLGGQWLCCLTKVWKFVLTQQRYSQHPDIKRNLLRKAWGQISPENLFLSAQFFSQGQDRGKSVGFWVISVGICKQTRQQGFVFLVFINNGS